jgi:hypothetical protein
MTDVVVSMFAPSVDCTASQDKQRQIDTLKVSDARHRSVCSVGEIRCSVGPWYFRAGQSFRLEVYDALLCAVRAPPTRAYVRH